MRQSVQVKEEELISRETATGALFIASLGLPVAVELRCASPLCAMFIQRYIRSLYPRVKTLSMTNTYHARDTAVIGAGWEYAYDELQPNTPLYALNLVYFRFCGKDAQTPSRDSIFKRLRVGLPPEGGEQLELKEPKRRLIEAADTVRRYNAAHCTTTWSDKFQTTRYTEIPIPTVRSVPKQGYLKLAENVKVPISSDHCKSLDVAFIPHTRFYVILALNIP